MNSAFSAIVACLQEMELALQGVQNKAGGRSLRGEEDLREEIRSFFSGPSVEQARRIHHWIRSRENQTDFLRITVSVDGMQVSLAALNQELEEVLEDFRP